MSGSIQVTEEYLFPSLVWYADISGSAKINKKLIADIAALRASSKSVKKSNELGWHSPTNMHKRGEFKPLCDVIDGMAGTIKDSMKVGSDRRLIIETFWVNVNPKHAYNALHDHPNSAISGVYYVQVDDKSGQLRFRDPRGAKRMDPWPVASGQKSDMRHWDRVNYKPVAGRLIMFPSWLEHDVEPNLSDNERISISFNMVFRKSSA
ncbi:MAG: hypothetical protein HC855_07965 [Rhizobiales bacterium]|nr:hypothetical protein [Hyphomicrobiales bacterium]